MCSRESSATSTASRSTVDEVIEAETPSSDSARTQEREGDRTIFRSQGRAHLASDEWSSCDVRAGHGHRGGQPRGPESEISMTRLAIGGAKRAAPVSCMRSCGTAGATGQIGRGARRTLR